MIKKLLKRKQESRDVASSAIERCRKCYSFKYDNSWHFERPEYLLQKDIEEKVTVKFSQCPACIEETLAMYDMEYV